VAVNAGWGIGFEFGCGLRATGGRAAPGVLVLLRSGRHPEHEDSTYRTGWFGRRVGVRPCCAQWLCVGNAFNVDALCDPVSVPETISCVRRGETGLRWWWWERRWLMEREAAQMGLKGGRSVVGDGTLVVAVAGRSRLGRSKVDTLEGITSLSKDCLDPLAGLAFQTGAAGRTLCRRKSPCPFRRRFMR
jgi:hypothetical protein